MHYRDAIRHCLFRYVSGSHAYGTERPDSDIDHRGVFAAPLEEAFHLFVREEADGTVAMGVQEVRASEGDEVLYELRKFLKLATDCNPNIIEAFWVDRGIERETAAWRRIRESRHLFLSRKARHTFSGYAFAQLKRMRKHREYHANPPARPTREQFGLPGHSEIPEGVRGSLMALGEEWVRPEHRDLVAREKEFQAAMEAWRAWDAWQRERNPKRRELEDRFGYDTKHAAHAVRLMRMAVEILRDGEVVVHRPDREELRAIMQGAWSFDDLEAFAEATDRTLETLYRASPLPHGPDKKGISALYVELCESLYGIPIRGRDPDLELTGAPASAT